MLRRNIKTIRLSNKLDYIKLGPFRIRKILRLINYKLDLLIKMRIYLSFYFLILEPVDPETLVQTNLLSIDLSGQVSEDKIETILKKRLVKRKELTRRRKKYFIK